MKSEVESKTCKCTEIIGHLDEVQELLMPRAYKPSPGCLALGDWRHHWYKWPGHVRSCDRLLDDESYLMTKESKYWTLDDVKRYYTGDLHCEKVLFTCQYPNLELPTRLGRYLWKSNTALKIPPQLYMKELHMSMECTLKKIESEQGQMDRLIVCDQYIKLDKLDYFKRKTYINTLLNILSLQDNLQLVSFENLCATRLEGVRLVQQLACFNANTLKYLFLWRFVQPNENPLLINFRYISGSGKYIPRPSTEKCFTRSLGFLKNLRVLALEYSHIADGTGAAILTLLPVFKKPCFRLQLICREDQIPGRADAALGVGGFEIPDSAWRQIAIYCPNLYLVMAFVRIRDYDNIIRFLPISLPLKEIYVQFGIDLKEIQRQDSDFSCLIKLLAYRYASTLGVLCIHQWRFVTFPLRRIVEVFPNLEYFEFVGCVEDEIDLRKMLNLISCGVCSKLKKIHISIQAEDDKLEYWSNTLKLINEDYAQVMKLFDISSEINIYKSYYFFYLSNPSIGNMHDFFLFHYLIE